MFQDEYFFCQNNNLKISSVVKDKIGANHFNNEFKIMFKSIIVDLLFFDSLGSQ